jgi:starvation-inducible DNA-binding protein
MGSTKAVSTSATDGAVAAAAAQFLSPVVLGLQALVINTKQAHWHVRGANFIGIHEFFDTIVDHASTWADDAAERIVALGLPIDARLETISAKVSGTKVAAGFSQSPDSIRAVIADIDAVIADVRVAIDGLDEVDLTSQDVAIAIMQGLEKDRWFLVSHIAE